MKYELAPLYFNNHGGYLLYYAAMILYDLKTSGRTAATGETGELTFSETISPQEVEHLPEKVPETTKPQPAIIGSGGVTLKNLFGLCRDEAVLYTRSVSF